MIESSPKSNGPTFSKNLHAYVYHQLALLYFHRGRRFSTKGDVKMSTDMFKKAIIAVKKAVAANQTKYIYWNTLGVIAYCMCSFSTKFISSFVTSFSFTVTGNDELSQHAFIKSLEIVDNNVVAWCNLGMLYLKHDKPMLAHEVFTKAQSVSPLHSFSWIGQVN
jgi:tetratricopeptide (TPR) repeat protein